MVLKSNLTYEPPMQRIEEEDDVIVLLDDVAANLHSIGYTNPAVSFKEFLRIVEEGKYEAQGKDKFNINSVDLSKAKDLIKEYRFLSEGGCQSCVSLRKFNPSIGETVKYCNMFENEQTAPENPNVSSNSPRVERFYEEGCTERTAILPKTIETILKESA